MKYKEIILNIPHSSTAFPKGTKDFWEDKARLNEDIDKWTDKYTDVIFSPRDEEISKRVHPFVFPYSRFFCDFERLENDPLEKIGQGIIYTDFNSNKRCLTDEQKEHIKGIYDGMKESLCFNIEEAMGKGDTLVIDCHSYPDDGGIVDVCIGWNDDWSRPDEWLLTILKNFFEDYGLKVGFNYPYSNSITPLNGGYHSVMIELNKRVYLDKNGNFNDFFKKHNDLINYLLYKKILDL